MIKKLSLLIVCVLFSGLANAANKNLLIGVNVSETYNDNLNLAADGTTKMNDFIFQLNPYISYRRDSRKLKLNLDYRLQSLFYTDFNQNDTVFHQFSGDVDANLFRDVFFVKAAARYGQATINASVNQPLNNVSLSSNRTNLASINVNPYGVFKLGRVANATVGINRGMVRYKATALGDSDRTNYYVSIDSGKEFQKVRWNTNFTHDISSFSGQQDIIFERYDVGLNYAISRKFSLLTTVGTEKNTYQRAAATSSPDASFWDVGVIWNPSTLTSAELRFGDRFFGRTGTFRLTNKTRKTETLLNYTEEVTTPAITEFNRQVFTVTDSFGNPVTDAAGNPNGIDITLPIATAETFIRKRLDFNFQYRAAKSRWNIGAYHVRRLYQTTNDEETLYGINGNFDWNFTLRTRLLLNATGRVQEFRASSRKDGIANVGITIQRQMRRRLTGNISIQHVRQNSTVNANDYKQNVFIVGVDWRL